MIQPNCYYGVDSYDSIYERHNVRATTNTYAKPHDQISQEIKLLAEFEERHKTEQERWCLRATLHSLNKVVGGELGLKIVDIISSNTSATELPIDDMGYFNRSGTGLLRSNVFLTRISESEYRAAMANAKTEAEKRLAEAQWRGYVLGVVPDCINDAFDTVFQIIGAEKVRDDREENLPNGTILWRGEYGERTVYVEQLYSICSEYNGMALFMASVTNEAVGQTIATELRGNDFEELVSIGMNMQEIRDGEARGELRHDNAAAIVTLASQLR